MIDSTILAAVGILFAATLMRSTFGFGDALIAMPLLTLILNIQVATPVVALTSIAIGVMIVAGSWHEIEFGAVRPLIAAALLGVPAGIALLKYAPEPVVLALLGVSLILFGCYSWIRPEMSLHVGRGWAYLCGFLAGCLGGAYNVHGPPIVVYGALRHWPPPQFRASLQSFFLPSSILILIGHGLGGLWSVEAFWLFGVSLAPVIVAVFLGGRLNRLIPPGRFDRTIYAIVVGLGVLLIVRATAMAV